LRILSDKELPASRTTFTRENGSIGVARCRLFMVDSSFWDAHHLVAMAALRPKILFSRVKARAYSP
jgi:hypothetical protein